MHKTRRFGLIRPLLGALVLGVGVGPAMAQGPSLRVMESALADTFTREAMSLATLSESPEPALLEAASLLLERASALTPRDAERHRLRAELARLTGDAAARQSALTAYVRLEPRDDTAMLALLLSRIEGTQTLDGRLASIENVLNSSQAAERLSGALRSRLAWFAAEAALELGDTDRYVRWLRESAGLDPSFAPAARATYGLLLERGLGSKALGAGAKNWVESSPVDPAARLALAEVLFSEAAYLDAAQQYANAARLSTQTPLPWDAYRAWSLSLGAAGDERVALDLLGQLEQLIAAGQFGEVAEGEDPGLPLDLEIVRLTLMGGAQPELEGRDEDGLRASLQRVRGLLRDRPAGEGATEAALELAWVEALFGDPALADEALVGADAEHPLARRARGWQLLREGDAQGAEDAFRRVREDPLAKLGLAILTGVDDPGRARFFREIVRDSPESLAALITAQMLHGDNRGVEPTAEGQAVLDLMQRTPIQVWRLDLERDPWLTLNLKARPVSARAFEPTVLEVSIRNNAQVPVSLGQGSTVNGTVLLNTGVFSEGQAVGSLPTQVVDAARRLTIRPGERLVVTHRLDWGVLGQTAESDPSRSFSYAISGLLEPRVTGGGGMAMAPLGSTDTLRGLAMEGQAVTDALVNEWIDKLDAEGTGDPFERVLALGRLAQIGDGPLNNLLDPSTSNRVAEALNSGVRGFDALTLGWVVAHLETRATGSAFQAVLDAAARSESTDTRIAHLLGQADDADDPALDAAARSSDAALRAFAEAYRAALEAERSLDTDALPLLP